MPKSIYAIGPWSIVLISGHFGFSYHECWHCVIWSKDI